MASKPFHSGFAAIVGKPNAGKSTLLNALLGTHLSIATHKAQTTRHQITGILTEEHMQVVFLDTPGLIQPKYRLQEYMMRMVEKARNEADCILLISDGRKITLSEEDLAPIQDSGKKCIVIINKIDIAEQQQVQEQIDFFQQKLKPEVIIPLSALEQKGLDTLKAALYDILEEGPPFYPEDELSTHPMRFFASELIREQLFLLYQDEVPYMSQVEITAYEESEEIHRIYADIIVARGTQKGILIGKGGSALKKLGIQSRKSIEEFTGIKVYLELHVKVREGWRDKDGFLRSYGYQ